MVLEVTAKTTSGEAIFHASKIYMPQSTDSLGSTMVLGPDKKLGLIRDTSIQPFAPKDDRFEIELPATVRNVAIEVKLTYQPRPGDEYLIEMIRKNTTLSGS